jgi:4-hydroxy-tetrahydrodipicolinate reductase
VKILIVGHGRMGRLVEAHAASHGCEVVAVVDNDRDWASWEGSRVGADVAIEFSEPEAVRPNIVRLAARGVNAAIGTTGWQRDEAEVRRVADQAGIGVLAAANFALGVHVFRTIVEEAARRFAPLDDVGAWLHETHHAAKKDAPSGTALLLKSAIESAGYGRPLDVSSTRVGSVPGTHQVGFDGPADTVTLTHTVRDRAVFAHGALEAARWLKARRGWFTVADMFRE